MKKTKKLLTGLLILAAGILIGWLVKPATTGGYPHETDHGSGVEPATWTCSMHPQIRQSEPGKCPICGMDLIPLEEETAQGGGDPTEIRMSATAMQLANVQTAVVGYGIPTREVRMNGKVQPDERKRFTQVTHLEGRIEVLTVNFTGESVRAGQKLAEIYSPELVTAQEELFSAARIRDMQPGLYQAAVQKLKNWKLTDQQIQTIIDAGKPQDRFPILADVSGIVLNKKVNLGDYLMRGMPLYDVVDLSGVWVLFDVYESDMPWAKVGSLVEFTVPSLPGERFQGKITFIDPVINPVTRVAAARVEMPNPGGKLKPEMFAEGLVKTRLGSRRENIIIPRSAVMWTGERSLVYLKRNAGAGTAFRMREVELGPLTADGYLVVKGLEAGDEVVVNGVFTVDAAAQLAGKPSMMNPGPEEEASTLPAEANPGAKSKIKALFDLYFPLKDALVKDDLRSARKQAADLIKAFSQTDKRLFTGLALAQWMKNSSPAAESLTRIAGAGDVEEARKFFKPLSGQMVALAKAFGPFGETVYVQHCPMADNNTGADWLSLDEQILNPYFGDKMLKCGSVTDKIQ